MTAIEQIKAEIRRIAEKAKQNEEKAFQKKDDKGLLISNAKLSVCVTLMRFIDSLQTDAGSPKPEKQNTKEDYCYQCKWYVKNIRFGDDCPYWKNMINPIKCEHFKHKNTEI